MRLQSFVLIRAAALGHVRRVGGGGTRIALLTAANAQTACPNLMGDIITDGRSGSSLFQDAWKLDDVVEREGGPTMTVDGTMVKLMVLLLLFFIGFLFSSHHFHSLRLSETPAEKIRTTLSEMPAWQGYWFYTLVRYPLYAWLLFFVGFGGCFLLKRGLVILAPICAAIQGVSCGAFEYVLMDHYPGITMLCALMVVGIFLGLFLVYWLGLSTIEDGVTLFIAGAVGGLAFTYPASVVLDTFAVTVPYLHKIPINWGLGLVMVLMICCGLLVHTLATFQKAVEAGAPKWMEWRAAMCLFASFLIFVRMLRRLLVRRSVGNLIWDSLNEAANGLKR